MTRKQRKNTTLGPGRELFGQHEFWGLVSERLFVANAFEDIVALSSVCREARKAYFAPRTVAGYAPELVGDIGQHASMREMVRAIFSLQKRLLLAALTDREKAREEVYSAFDLVRGPRGMQGVQGIRGAPLPNDTSSSCLLC